MFYRDTSVEDGITAENITQEEFPLSGQGPIVERYDKTDSQDPL